MEGENEITVVVENPTAEVTAIAEVHGETDIALAEVRAEENIAVAEIQAAAVVAVAEAQAETASVDMGLILGRLDAMAADNAALRSELAELRAAAIVEEIEEAEEEEEIEEIIDGEIPASVVAAEAIEPPLVETPAETPARKRHFVSL